MKITIMNWNPFVLTFVLMLAYDAAAVEKSAKCMDAGGNPISSKPFQKPGDCRHYYQCSNGYLYTMPCGPETVFNPATGNCDWPYNVPGCGATTTTTPICYIYTILDDKKVDYQGAVDACKEAGFELASHFLYANTKPSEKEEIGRQALGNSVFVGLRRPFNDINGWKYIDGTVSTKANTPWNSGEPNNARGDEACAEMIGNSAPYYLLNDFPCNWKRYPFCEKYVC